MDFDAYLAMVAGDMRKVYDAAFGQQITEMEIQEIVVNVRTDDLGGRGPGRNAGFREGHDVEDHYHLCEDETAPDAPGWSKEILLFGVVSDSLALEQQPNASRVAPHGDGTP